MWVNPDQNKSPFRGLYAVSGYQLVSIDNSIEFGRLCGFADFDAVIHNVTFVAVGVFHFDVTLRDKGVNGTRLKVVTFKVVEFEEGSRTTVLLKSIDELGLCFGHSPSFLVSHDRYSPFFFIL
jgi:hypothetical protein